MHIFSYVITHDSGFAPNPFCGFLTLATCKPRIRQQARKGDYVVGTGSSATVGNQRMVYAAQIADVVPLADYGRLGKYEMKRPSVVGRWWRRHGDNIYFQVDGRWKRRRNFHHGQEAMDRDIGGKNALVCEDFWYFGDEAINIPSHLESIIKKGPGHKRITDESVVKGFIEWLTTFPRGRHGNPEMQEERKTSRCDGVGSSIRC